MKKKILFLLIIIILIGAKFSFADTNIAIKDTIFPPPNNFVAQGWGSCIFLSWNAPDPSVYTLMGYNLYRDDIGYIGFIPIEPPTVFIDMLVIIGVEYTYMLTALYEEGESDPVTASATLIIIYIENFELDDGGFVGTGEWEWGIPTSGPGNAYSGERLWATNLSGNYMNNANYTLDSPETEIIEPTFSFWHYYDIEYYWDGGNVKISTDGGATWTIIIPVGGYPEDAASSSNAGIPGEPCYSGNSGGWVNAIFDVSAYVGETVYLRWHFGSDGYVQYPGWYIDDVLIGLGIPPEYGVLQGTVTDGSGNPLECVSVHAESYVTNYLVYTNIDGEYLINPMMTGLYDITFELEHYNVMVEEDVEIVYHQVTILNMIMTAPTMSIYPTYVDTSMIPNTQLTVYLTISNDGDGPLHWFANIVFPDGNNVYNNVANELKIDSSEKRDTNQNAITEYSPEYRTISGINTKDIWDLQFVYPIGVGEGEAGIECDGDYIYTTKWNGNAFYKYELDGTYIGEFTVTGCSGSIRDLAYDGTYMYGGAATNTVFEMDFDTQNVISTINAPVAVRAIAYDDVNDGFWANNWSTDITLFDRTGGFIWSFPCQTFGSFYGFAYDNFSDGGPYLWGFSQDGSGNVIVQFDATTGLETGVTFDVTSAIGATSIAGGLFISVDVFEPGIVTIGGLVQNEYLFGFELCDTPWPPPPPMQGIIEAGQSYDWPLIMNSTGQTPGTILKADIIFTSDPDVGTITIPVTVTIIGSGVDDVLDISPKLYQNYPNPFNSSTTISFSLSHRDPEDTEIKIYNIKGQLINTLIPMTNDQCPMTTIEWNGKDENGDTVSSGIYFYRLEVGDKVIDTKKCLLLK